MATPNREPIELNETSKIALANIITKRYNEGRGSEFIGFQAIVAIPTLALLEKASEKEVIPAKIT